MLKKTRDLSYEELKKLDIHKFTHKGLNGDDEITCINGIFVKVEDLKKLLKKTK